jgi:hypothetical protein
LFFKGFSFCVGFSRREILFSRLEKFFSHAENSFSPCKVTTFRRGGDDFRELRIDTELFYEIFHDTWRKHLLMGLLSHGLQLFAEGLAPAAEGVKTDAGPSGQL